MIDRRRTLKALLSFVAVGATCRLGNCSDHLQFSNSNAAGDSARRLEGSLQEMIRLCQKHVLNTEACRLCEIALLRVHKSVDDAPRFWQACTDSVFRLELQFSQAETTNSKGVGQQTAMLYQLRSLKEQLEDRTVQAIGRRGWLCQC